MNNFKIGDWVYGDDWCYGQIMDIDNRGALVEYETAGGGGSVWFNFDELEKVPEHRDEPVIPTPEPNPDLLSITIHVNEIDVYDPDEIISSVFKQVSKIKDRMVNITIM